LKEFKVTLKNYLGPLVSVDCMVILGPETCTREECQFNPGWQGQIKEIHSLDQKKRKYIHTMRCKVGGGPGVSVGVLAAAVVHVVLA
jgi:hypothetical protein